MSSKKHPLIVNSLFKSFNRVPILENLSITVDNGTTIGIAGKNGTGKSTLLKIIAGIISPDKGDGMVYGKTIFNRSYEYRKYLAYWGQTPSLYPSLTGMENIELSVQLSKKTYRYNDLEKYIDESGIADKINDPVITYSMGMVQKLNLLRFILSSWQLGLMDEPTSSLDDDGIQQLKKCFKQWNNENKAMIVSSHDTSFLETVASDIIYLDKRKS